MFSCERIKCMSSLRCKGKFVLSVMAATQVVFMEYKIFLRNDKS
jgi:hypothetical protein